MGKHDKSNTGSSGRAGTFDPRTLISKGGDGKHRADEPQSGPVGNRTNEPHHPDGWFPERD